MSTLLPRPNTPIPAQPSRDVAPRRLIVTAGVVAFAVRDWSLWVLLRQGPWGPPMRLVLGNESVAEAVGRTLDALLLWANNASLLCLKSGWQEQQVQVWNSTEQGTAVSLIHSILLRANRDELRPNLHLQPVPSLRVEWVPVHEIEAGERSVDANIRPDIISAIHSLRGEIQHNPEILLRYLADMGMIPSVQPARGEEWWQSQPHPASASAGRATLPLSVLKEPAVGDGTLTLAEASLLYKAFFPPDEQIDLSQLRRRFLHTDRLDPLDEERPVRGLATGGKRLSRVYRYVTE